MATVETYKLYAGSGRYVRQATQVVYSDGSVIRFMEKMSKREAVRQAEMQRSK